MGAGKIFCILGGIVTLLATFLFSFMGGPGASLYYIGFLMNLGYWFGTGEVLIIVMCVVFLIFMFAGVFILAGLKVRALAILGSIFAILLGLYLVLSLYGVLPIEVSQFVLLFANINLVEGIIPVNLVLGNVSIGTYLMIGGGVLGLIGGIMGPDDF